MQNQIFTRNMLALASFALPLISSVTSCNTDAPPKGGRVLDRTVYTPCGDPISKSDLSATAVNYTAFGHEAEKTLDTLDFGARHFSSKLCRFFSVDPVDDPTGSTYRYADNNFLNSIDPDGRQEKKMAPSDWEKFLANVQVAMRRLERLLTDALPSPPSGFPRISAPGNLPDVNFPLPIIIDSQDSVVMTPGTIKHIAETIRTVSGVIRRVIDLPGGGQLETTEYGEDPQSEDMVGVMRLSPNGSAQFSYGPREKMRKYIYHEFDDVEHNDIVNSMGPAGSNDRYVRVIQDPLNRNRTLLTPVLGAPGIVRIEEKNMELTTTELIRAKRVIIASGAGFNTQQIEGSTSDRQRIDLSKIQ